MIEAVFWVGLAMVGVTYFAYPAALWIITLWRPRSDRCSPHLETELPSMDVVVAAHNEGRVIGAKVRNTLELDYPAGRLRLLVISDGSTDNTAEEARSSAPPDRLTAVRVRENKIRKGKTAAINDALDELNGELVLFTDANAHLEPDAARQLASRLANPDVGCAVGELSYENRKEPGVRYGEGLYWRYENAIKSMESQLGSTIVANGAIYAVRRRHLHRLPESVEFDCTLPLQIIRDGYRVVFHRAARARERAADSLAEEMRRKARIVNVQVVSLMSQGWELMRWPGPMLIQLICHKVLRWLAAPMIPLLLACAAYLRHQPGARLILYPGIAFLGAGLVGLTLSRWQGCPRLLRVPAYFLAVNGAAAVGLLGALTGHRITTWASARSTR